MEVFVEKGMASGQKIVFAGEGDQNPDIIAGDVVIIIEQKEHELLTRKGNDLFLNLKINLLTALAGGQFSVTQLDGRILLVTSSPGEVIKPGDTKCIIGEGMPS